VHLLLFPALLAAIFVASGCSSSQKNMARMEREMAKQNSRLAEERRMRAIDNGDAASRRGAEVLVVDPNKSFDPSRSGVGTAREFGTGGTRVKEFNFEQKARPKNYLARDFRGARDLAAGERKFATGEANTGSKYAIPNTDKEAARKTAETRRLWDGDKVAATKEVYDGKRPYLGPESKKLGNAVDPKSLADWRSGGGETVTYAPGTVDRIGTLKQLSIDDVRELLNKNK
jgi:hypothetical protein